MFLSPERPRRWSGVLIRAKQPFSNLAAHCNPLESIKKKKKNADAPVVPRRDSDVGGLALGPGIWIFKSFQELAKSCQV